MIAEAAANRSDDKAQVESHRRERPRREVHSPRGRREGRAVLVTSMTWPSPALRVARRRWRAWRRGPDGAGVGRRPGARQAGGDTMDPTRMPRRTATVIARGTPPAPAPVGAARRRGRAATPSTRLLARELGFDLHGYAERPAVASPTTTCARVRRQRAMGTCAQPARAGQAPASAACAGAPTARGGASNATGVSRRVAPRRCDRGPRAAAAAELRAVRPVEATAAPLRRIIASA